MATSLTDGSHVSFGRFQGREAIRDKRTREIRFRLFGSSAWFQMDSSRVVFVESVDRARLIRRIEDLKHEERLPESRIIGELLQGRIAVGLPSRWPRYALDAELELDHGWGYPPIIGWKGPAHVEDFDFRTVSLHCEDGVLRAWKVTTDP